MSEQNNYRIALNYKRRETEEWSGWVESGWWKTADNWQDAIQECLDDIGVPAEYTVVAETPSEDGKSGIIEIEFDPTDYWVGLKMQATPQRADRSAG